MKEFEEITRIEGLPHVARPSVARTTAPFGAHGRKEKSGKPPQMTRPGKPA